jgi:hypothetical protein
VSLSANVHTMAMMMMMIVLIFIEASQRGDSLRDVQARIYDEIKSFMRESSIHSTICNWRCCTKAMTEVIRVPEMLGFRYKDRLR